MTEVFMHDKDIQKGCFGCVCHDNEDTGCCNITGVYSISPEHSHCPLRSLEAHDAEVRKAAIEEFFERLIAIGEVTMVGGSSDNTLFDAKLLDIEQLAKELIKNG